MIYHKLVSFSLRLKALVAIRNTKLMTELNTPAAVESPYSAPMRPFLDT